MNLVSFRDFLGLVSCLLPEWNALTQRKLPHNASLGVQSQHWFILKGSLTDPQTDPHVQKR